MNKMRISVLAFLIVAIPLSASAQTAPGSRYRLAFDLDFSVDGAPDSAQSYSGTFVAFSAAPTPVTATATYPTLGTNRAIQVRGAYLLWRSLALRVNFRSTSSTKVATVEATAPHPFLMVPTATDDISTDSKRRDVALDVAVVYYAAVGDKVRVGAFAGPTRFSVSQEMIDHISYSQTVDPTGPFNSITLSHSALRTENVRGAGWGFNIGGDLSIFPHRNIGFGAEVKYTRAMLRMVDPLTKAANELKVGGVILGVGLRLRL